MAQEQRIVEISREAYVELAQALEMVERWHDGDVAGPNFVLFTGLYEYRKLVFVPKKRIGRGASQAIPDSAFKNTPLFGFWDRLYAKLAWVEDGQDQEDGMPFVRPPHPVDWILRPLTKWRKR